MKPFARYVPAAFALSAFAAAPVFADGTKHPLPPGIKQFEVDGKVYKVPSTATHWAARTHFFVPGSSRVVPGVKYARVPKDAKTFRGVKVPAKATHAYTEIVYYGGNAPTQPGTSPGAAGLLPGGSPPASPPGAPGGGFDIPPPPSAPPMDIPPPPAAPPSGDAGGMPGTPPGSPPAAPPGSPPSSPPGSPPATPPGSPPGMPPGTPPGGPPPLPPGATPPGGATPPSTPPGATPPGTTPIPPATPPGTTPPGAIPPGATPPGTTPPGVPPTGPTPPSVPPSGPVPPSDDAFGPPGATPPGGFTPPSGPTPPGGFTPPAQPPTQPTPPGTQPTPPGTQPTPPGGTPPSTGPEPGSRLQFVTLNQQQQRNGLNNPILTDIVSHLPRSYGNTYYDRDPITWGHETTHGINSHIRNTMNNTGGKANGFYVLNNQAVVLVEPRMRKSAVAAYVPRSLRGSRFGTYVTGSSSWDDTPTYLLDEWVAYVNGGHVGVDMVKRGQWTTGRRDGVAGQLEFTVYAIALAMAVERNDANYFRTNLQFREFIAWNARRAMKNFYEGAQLQQFQGYNQGPYLQAIRTSADAANMRAWITRTYGAKFAREVFGF